MRQIKFRGRRIGNDTKEWVYGQLVYFYDSFGDRAMITVQGTGKHGIINPRYTVEPATVGQFTGLLDRNGTEIYEGDIVTICGKYSRVVEWFDLCWAIIPIDYFNDPTGEWHKMTAQRPDVAWWKSHEDSIEIIGNIHDNPELIK